ncbi:MAG TPA: hypothetical protein VKU01_31975 [Bryobacteraceae bacterium]|nr:hypothetical protein [Bryobacteraceae bacterium]
MRKLIFLFTLACYAQEAAPPAAVIGVWGYTETRATQYQNRATGSFARPSGSSVKMEIYGDGSFKDSGLIQQSMYNCTSTIFITRAGHVTFEGNAVVFHYEGGHVSSKDNCNARFNYEKGAAPEVRRFDAWTIRDSANGQQLLLATGGQVKFVYTRSRE